MKSLFPTFFIDSNSPIIIEKALSIVRGCSDETSQSIKLFYFIRDQIPYNPYAISLDKSNYIGSHILRQGFGFCIQKAILLASLSRAVGIPCRLRFANVKNHLASERIKTILKSNIFVFHGYNEMFINNRWVKVTATFHYSLCRKAGINPLDFDGIHDSLHHHYDIKGNKHMEYIQDYGSFEDFPYDMMVREISAFYPHLNDLIEKSLKGETVIAGDFDKEVMEESNT